MHPPVQAHIWIVHRAADFLLTDKPSKLDQYAPWAQFTIGGAVGALIGYLCVLLLETAGFFDLVVAVDMRWGIDLLQLIGLVPCAVRLDPGRR